MYVVVQFYPKLKFYFPLFQTHDTPQQKKIKFEPRIKLNHNMHNGLVCQFLSHAG